MREQKTHWNDGTHAKYVEGWLKPQRSLCGRMMYRGFAHWKRKVTCKQCAKLLAYKGK